MTRRRAELRVQRHTRASARVDNEAAARDTPIGRVPTADALDVSGLGMSAERVDRLLAIDGAAWLDECPRSFEFLSRFGERLPRALVAEHKALVQRITDSIH